MLHTQATSFSAVNGLGLALVIPAAQSLVADYYEEKSRGAAFGLLFGVSSLGARPALCRYRSVWQRSLFVCLGQCGEHDVQPSSLMSAP